MNNTIKAISIQQPWAWAIIRPDLQGDERLEAMHNNLIKDIENRNWKYPPTFRGQLLIHASQKFDYEGWKWIQETFPEIPVPPDHITNNRREISDGFNRGGFVGICRMNDVVEMSDSPWFFGPLGFKLRMQKPIKFIPYKGQLGLFDVPDDVISRIEVIADGRPG